MSVAPSAVEYLVDLFQRRADELAVQYQQGNFRSLRCLVHRAALLARTEGAAEVTEGHLALAAEHGELKVEKLRTSSRKGSHVRTVFVAALAELNVSINLGFLYDDLKEITKSHPLEVGYAFLRCATVEREAPDAVRKWYELQEIERALTPGMSGRGTFIGKRLTLVMLTNAIAQYYAKFRIPTSGVAAGANSVKELIDKLREAMHVGRISSQS